MRKLSPFSQERLRVHLLENHGRKIPTKGETLAISVPSEGKGASQDYNSQDKQTSQSGFPVLKPQRKGQRPWGSQAGTDRAGPALGSRCAGLNRCSPEVDPGGQFPLLCRQLGLGKKNKTGIFVRSVDGSQGFGVRTRDRRIPTSKERLDSSFLRQGRLEGRAQQGC